MFNLFETLKVQTTKDKGPFSLLAGNKVFLFVLLIFLVLSTLRRKAKQKINKRKNTPTYARSGNES